MISDRRHGFRSFAGGEVSPEMYGRADLQRYGISLKECTNFVITPQGVAETRAGSQYIANLGNQPIRLLSYIRPDELGMVLAVTGPTATVYLMGNPVLSLQGGTGHRAIDSVTLDPATNTPIFESTSHGLAVNEPIFLLAIQLADPDSSRAAILGSYLNRELYVESTPSADTFTVSEAIGGDPVDWSGLRDSYGQVSFNVSAGAEWARSSYVWTEPVVLNIPAARLRYFKTAQYRDDMVIVDRAFAPKRLVRSSDYGWTVSDISFNERPDPVATDGTLVVTAEGTVGDDPISYEYQLAAAWETGQESQIIRAFASNTLRTAGNFNKLAFTAGAIPDGADWVNVYKGHAGEAVGWVGKTAPGRSIANFIDDNVTPDYMRTPHNPIVEFAAAGDYPAVVGFFEQRCVFAATDNYPQTFWVSHLGVFDYFCAGLPPMDDQAFSYELSMQRAVPIRHLLVMNEMLFFTAAGIFRVGAAGSEPFSASSALSAPVISTGADAVAAPQDAGNVILFPAERGGHLHQLSYTNEVGYETADLSLIAAHLVDGYRWTETAMQRSPYPVWYGLRSDGVIIALTFVPDQQVYAWHKIAMEGAVIESMAVVPEGTTDTLYVVTRRGTSNARHLERIVSRQTDDPRGSVHLDAYRVINNAIPSRTVFDQQLAGLPVGTRLRVIADGVAAGPYTRPSGDLDLGFEASQVIIGAEVQSRLETVPLADIQVEGAGMGVTKNVSTVWLRLKESLGVKVGVSFEEDDLREVTPEAQDFDSFISGAPPEPISGVVEAAVPSAWNRDSSVCIMSDSPYHATVTGMAIDYANG